MRVPGLLLLLLVFSLALASGCTDSPAQTYDGSGKIHISGAFALYPMMIRWSEEYRKIHPGTEFEISAGGAGKGMTDALSGMVDIGMVSRRIYPEEIARGAFYVAVAGDAVVGTVNAGNPSLTDLRTRGITSEDLRQIYINGTVTSWGQLPGLSHGSGDIRLYTRSDACGAAAVWAEYMGYHQEDLLGTGVYGDPGLAEAVKTDRLGIGYNNVNYAYDASTGLPVSGLAILPLDVNANGRVDADEDFYGTRQDLINAVADGRYPSPPARELNLVTKGGFSGETREFIRWILTEGQDMLLENGYIPLPPERAEQELAKI